MHFGGGGVGLWGRFVADWHRMGVISGHKSCMDSHKRLGGPHLVFEMRKARMSGDRNGAKWRGRVIFDGLLITTNWVSWGLGYAARCCPQLCLLLRDENRGMGTCVR